MGFETPLVDNFKMAEADIINLSLWDLKLTGYKQLSHTRLRLLTYPYGIKI